MFEIQVNSCKKSRKEIRSEAVKYDKLYEGRYKPTVQSIYRTEKSNLMEETVENKRTSH